MVIFTRPEPGSDDPEFDAPDNITMSPYGGLMMCEDGLGEQHILGTTEDGEVFKFARNRVNNGTPKSRSTANWPAPASPPTATPCSLKRSIPPASPTPSRPLAPPALISDAGGLQVLASGVRRHRESAPAREVVPGQPERDQRVRDQEQRAADAAAWVVPRPRETTAVAVSNKAYAATGTRWEPSPRESTATSAAQSAPYAASTRHERWLDSGSISAR